MVSKVFWRMAVGELADYWLVFTIGLNSFSVLLAD